MSLRSLGTAVFLAISACIAACGEGAPELESRSSLGSLCTFISGGDTEVSYSLPQISGACSLSSLEAAIDGDADSAALMHADKVLEGECAVRVSAQEGIVFPAGNVAAVVASIGRSGLDNSALTGGYAVVRTLLSGAVQEESVISSGNSVASINFSHSTGRTFFELSTSKPFDSIELAVGSPGETLEIEVFEFCSAR